MKIVPDLVLFLLVLAPGRAFLVTKNVPCAAVKKSRCPCPLAMATTARPRAPPTSKGAKAVPKSPRARELGREGTQGVDRSPLRKSLDTTLSMFTILCTGLIFRLLLAGLNRVECRNREVLLDAVLNRGGAQGLLTVSNHVSVYDDPGLWAAIIPFWRTGVEKMRWSLCTDDIYFSNKRLSSVLKAGKTLPIKRRLGMEQRYLQDFFNKLEAGDWGHIFAEGAIRQPWRFGHGKPLLGDFKVGIGRILLRSKNPPMVLPMYHIGLHQVAPETPVPKGSRGKLVNMLPNVGRRICVYVGEPVDVSPIVDKWKASKTP
ncbi:unnamed protein product [Discosporangium mesarthrocarpum]